MLTQLSHNRLGRINLRPLDVETHATTSLSLRCVQSADVFLGTIAVHEYASTVGSLFKYTYELGPEVELRMEHETECMKMMLMVEGHITLKQGLPDDSVVTRACVCLFRSRDYTITLQAQSKVSYLLFNIEPLAKRLELEGFEEGRYYFTESMQAQLSELLNPPRILALPEEWLLGQLVGMVFQLNEAKELGKRLSPQVYHFDYALAADKFIQRNLSKDHTTKEISRQVGLNEHALKIVFADYFGMGMAKWQNLLRIEMAKILLHQSRKRISEIGEEVGYTNRGTFTTNFTHFTGLKPVQWRKKYSI